MGYIDGSSAVGDVLEGILADKTNIFFNFLPLLVHLTDVVLTSFLLQPLQHVLIFLHNLHQLPLPIRLIQSLLLIFTQVLIHPGVRCLAT